MVPRVRLGCDQLRGERAITSLDKPFTPSRRSTERVARHNPIGPPPSFRPASPCPRQDRLDSRVTAVTTGTCHTPPLTAKAAAGLLVSLRLRFLPYSRHVRELPGPCFETDDADPINSSPTKGSLLFRSSSFSSFNQHPLYRSLVSGAFHPAPAALFNFRSRYIVYYRFGLVFRLGRLRLPYSREKTDPRYSGSISMPMLYDYGGVTLFAMPSQATSS
jgi:hypothetical protein